MNFLDNRIGTIKRIIYSDNLNVDQKAEVIALYVYGEMTREQVELAIGGKWYE